MFRLSIGWTPRRLLCLAVLLAGQAGAAPDAALEARVAHLAGQLRCLVCQNQTIADSQAQLALDLKRAVREQLAQGRSEQDVIDFMVQRYGDFVLYRPPLKGVTWLLWFGPFLLLSGALAGLLLVLRRQSSGGGAPPAAELRRGAALLAGHAERRDGR